MVSVAVCCCELWTSGFSPGLRALWCEWLGEAGGEEAATWLGYLVALHDLGKATPGFQGQDLMVREALVARGLPFPPAARPDHEAVGQAALTDLLSVHGPQLPVGALAQLADALANHHGGRRSSRGPRVAGERDLGGEPWRRLRNDLGRHLATTLGVTGSLPPGLSHPPAVLLELLGGVVRLCDWLASSGPASLDYPAVRRHARTALEPLRRSDTPPLTAFAARFGFAPNALQAAVEEASGSAAEPQLILIEAATGQGKTAAALRLAEHALVSGAAGTYFALPTRATANAMQARWPAAAEELAGLPPALTRHSGGLLRSEGAGTVDQALLALLGGPHTGLRWLGLARKTIILDEVHGYDAYTGELLERLLHWLRALRCTVVLLSATLPAARRQRLLGTWGAVSAGPVAPAALTRVRGASSVHRVLPAVPTRRVGLRWLAADGDLAGPLADALREGGVAVVYRNTVAAAQETYRVLRPQLAQRGLTVNLLHSQYPLAERRRRECAVCRQFGPDVAERPRGSVLVTTPLAESSLDLDFDLVVSDVAPGANLLQRLGRLHRFAATPRPLRLEAPQLWLLAPATDASGLADFGPSAAIYPEASLLSAYLRLAEHEALRLPDQVAELLAETLPPKAARAWRERWSRARAAQSRQETEQVWQARRHTRLPGAIGPDWRPAPVGGRPPSGGTRWAARPTTPVVFLSPERATALADGTDLASLRDEVVEAPGHDLAAALGDQPRPPGWDAVPELRGVYPVVTDDAGEWRQRRVRLHLDPELGLVTRQTESAP